MPQHDGHTNPAVPPPRTPGQTAGTPPRPVEIEVAGGCWRLDTLADKAGDEVYAAELIASPSPHQPSRRLWNTTQPDPASLEEALGWAIPHGALNVLVDRSPSGPAPDKTTREHPTLPDDAIHSPAYRPTRTSTVRRTGAPTTSYGRLLHTDNQATRRRWTDGPIQIDVRRRAGCP